MVFSPDGRTLAVADLRGVIRLWDVRIGQSTATLTGQKGSVLSMAFSPDGKLLASGSGDGTTLVWEVASEKHADR
jgi:WD40 repeat protein